MARLPGAGGGPAWHGCDCLPVPEADPAAAVHADSRRWRARDGDTPARSPDPEWCGRGRPERVLRWPGGDVRTDAGDAQTRFNLAEPDRHRRQQGRLDARDRAGPARIGFPPARRPHTVALTGRRRSRPGRWSGPRSLPSLPPGSGRAGRAPRAEPGADGEGWAFPLTVSYTHLRAH